jgi:hypothetical protein
VEQSISLQKRSRDRPPHPFSLTVAIVARSSSPLYRHPPCPFVLFLQIKLHKQDTFATTSANTTAPLPLPLFALTTTMPTSMATVHGCGKQATKFITPQDLSFLQTGSNLSMRNCIFTMPMMLSIIANGETLTFVEKCLTPFNNVYVTATHSLAFFLMRATFFNNSVSVISLFASSPILKRTSIDTTPQPSMKSLSSSLAMTNK